MTSIETHRLAFVARSKCLHIVKLLMFSVCASQAAARKAQPLWQQLGFQAKINERKIREWESEAIIPKNTWERE